MIYGSHQANFLPYYGFWDKVAQSDVFGLSGVEQFTKGDYQNRVKLLDENGNGKWLTIPVTFDFGMIIKDVKIGTSYKSKSIQGVLTANFRKSKNWKALSPMLLPVFDKYEHGKFIYDLNMDLLYLCGDLMGLSNKFVIETDTGLTGATDKLVYYVNHYKCDTYLSGMGGKQYIETDKFVANNIELNYVDQLPKKLGSTSYPHSSIVSHLFHEALL